MPWRLPHDKLGMFPYPKLIDRASMAAGVRLSVVTDSASLSGHVTDAVEGSLVDLCIGDSFVGSSRIDAAGAFSFDGLPSRLQRFDMWLPQDAPFRLRSLQLARGARVGSVVPDARPKWIAYGSSITQCRGAASPTQTWPSLASRVGGHDLTCLGYGGQCHLDPSIARIIRDRSADLISLCVGINIYNSASLNDRTLKGMLIGFVEILRERHVDTPIVVVSPIASPSREAVPNSAGLCLRDTRTLIEAVVRVLAAMGDRSIRYLSGLDLLGLEDAALLVDGLHPGAEGYRLIAKRFTEHVFTIAEHTEPAARGWAVVPE